MVKISGTEKNSLADKAGLLAGDYLISVNGNEINDVLDYRFFIAEKNITLKIHRGPELFDVTIKKDEYEDIGLNFETYLMDKQHECKNKCIFCFIDQNPCGMRDTIYFKDDDSRMTFLSGSYITLTNLSQKDVDRIIKMHISPINVSVHTTDPDLRVSMMKNKNAGAVLSYLDDFSRAGIKMNFQIVLCRGVNDGDNLRKTLTDLYEYYPAAQSTAIVPAGLTAHRKGLYPLTPFTKEECAEVIKLIDSFGDKCKAETGCRFFYPSDEFFIGAGLRIPDGDYYDGYPQYENGVGMIRSMQDEFDGALKFLPEKSNRSVSVATGEAAFPFISSLAETLEKKVPGFRCPVYKIKNNFFGGGVTVAGLLTAGDIIEGLRGKELGEELFISSYALRNGEDIFLDDMTLSELSDKLGVPVTPTEADGWAFAEALLGAEL